MQAGYRSRESVYGLGAAGRALIEAEGVQLGRRPSQNLEHHLGIVRAWTQSRAYARASGSVAMELVRSDSEIRGGGR